MHVQHSFGQIPAKSPSILCRAQGFNRAIRRYLPAAGLFCAGRVILKTSFGFLGTGLMLGGVFLAGWTFFKMRRRIFPPLYAPSSIFFSNKYARVLFFKTPKITTKWKYKCIDAATRTLEICGCLCGGKTFHKALEKIQGKLQTNRKLIVHIIACNSVLDAKSRKMMQQLSFLFKRQFHYLITPILFDLIPAIWRENHVKMVVCDGRYVVSGGTNFGDAHSRIAPSKNPSLVERLMGRTSHDFNVLIDDKDVCGRTCRALFFDLWNHWARECAPEKETLMISSDHSKTPTLEGSFFERMSIKIIPGTGLTRENACAKEYVRQIDSAEKSILIANMYFNPSYGILRALYRKKMQKPNISIRVIVPAIGPPFSLLYVPAARTYYKALTNLGIIVSEWKKEDTAHHIKAAVFDGEKAIIGSYNCGLKNDFDDELIFLFKGKAFAKKVSQSLMKSLKFTQKVPFGRARWYAYCPFGWTARLIFGRAL